MTPCAHASLTLTPPMAIEPGTCCTSAGLDSPNSITAAAVTTLLTDPGSNGDETGRLPIWRSPWRPMSWDGSKVSSLAIASTSPVLASSTTAEAVWAPLASRAS